MRLEQEAAFGGELEVFCTSRPESRLGPDGRVGYVGPITGRIDPKYIRQYLRENLSNCQLHLLLATGNSLIKGNNWVSYEMRIEAEEKFAPVVVIIKETHILIHGENDPRNAEGPLMHPLDRRELAKRAKWLSSECDIIDLNDPDWEVLLVRSISRHLGLAAKSG